MNGMTTAMDTETTGKDTWVRMLCFFVQHHRGRYLFRSCPGTFIKTSFHVLTSSNGLCDHHYISAIFCLCDCQFGGLCDLCLHQYVHIDGIRDPVAITRWYTIRNWGRMVFVTSITCLWYYFFVTVSLGVCVTFVCISMCTSMVFVIQLPLPDDIRFVIEDEEDE